MEFSDVVRRRRMIRSYDELRTVPSEVVDRILRHAVRAPSAGFSQGWGFLVLDTLDDIARFRQSATPTDRPDSWFAAQVRAPLIIVPHANKDAYLDRYAQPEKGHSDRSEDWWPAPYWDIDTGFASLLMLLTAVDEGFGCLLLRHPEDRGNLDRVLQRALDRRQCLPEAAGRRGPQGPVDERELERSIGGSF